MPMEKLKRFGGVQRSSFVFDSPIEKHIKNVQINWKTKNITPSEQFQNQIEISQKEAKSIPLIHKYMTAHFPSLIQTLQ